MVARNFSVQQEIPYSRLLQVPETDDRETNFLTTLEELKPADIDHHQQQQQQQQQQQNTNIQQYQPTYYELTNISPDNPCSSNLSPYQGNQNQNTVMDLQQQVDSNINPSTPSTAANNRKRKMSFQDCGSNLEEDNGEDVKSVKTNDDSKKQNHSEIEKRRRDKMNTYITELSAMIPMCHAMSRKLDKLTVLRMAVQHLKTIRGAVHSYTEGHYKPSFLSDQELKHLILQVADGFLFVVGCDRGRILYVSESVSKVLNYTQGDLLGQSLFDILHPKDVAKVKEQLTSSDLNPRERLIDAKTMLPVKTDVPQGVSRLCPGARRSFFCRMKCKMGAQVKEEADTTTGCHRRKKQQNSDKKYNVIHCTGYLKSWAPAKIGLEDQESDTDGGDTGSLSCLVAIGRILPHISTVTAQTQSKLNIKPVQFVSRHTLDGKFLFIDQRATLVLGFLPQELLGTSMYEYYHHDDIPSIAECHKCALQNSERVSTKIYRFRTKDGDYVKLQSEWKSFKNPWTKEIEYLIAKNTLVLTDFRTVETSSAARPDGIQEPNFEFFTQSNGKDMQKMINTHVEVSKIGRQIAEQVMDSQKRGGDNSSDSSPDPDPESSLTMPESHISTSVQSDQRRQHRPSSILHEYSQSSSQNFNHIRNNVALSSIANDPGGNADEGIMEMMTGTGTAAGAGDSSSMRESPNTCNNGGAVPGGAPTTDGNDEAAMAVIMSLLEADAGLGGPVDFSGLPWPLP